MVTAPLVTQGVKVDLPNAEAEPLSDDSKPPIIASVDANGQYYLNFGDSQDQAMTAVDLATLVAAQLRIDPATPVVVKGDGAVAYNEVVQLMVLLQRAGAPSVGLMTDSPEQSGQ
jgi:biopolymer transport protein TolR